MSVESTNEVARSYFSGMGQAVADRTINRPIYDYEADFDWSKLGGKIYFKDAYLDFYKKKGNHDAFKNGIKEGYSAFFEISQDSKVPLTPKPPTKDIETWFDVSKRVAYGNVDILRTPVSEGGYKEYKAMQRHLSQASLLMSGRHLQHGDETQKGRNIEVFSNCSTAIARHLVFELLLSGSGVGTLYNDEVSKVCDYNHMPIVVCTIDWGHKDVISGEIRDYLTLKNAKHLYADRTIKEFVVPDSREGWAEAIRIIDTMAYEKRRNEVLILDFSEIRCRNTPIRGMQNRPASGPGPLMSAISNLAKLRDAGMEAWRAAMYADHFLAECVLVGGARRAARMAVKHWTDKSIFDFISIKRGGYLWSSNNSIGVDARFWHYVQYVDKQILAKTPAARELEARNLLISKVITDLEFHAWKVFEKATEAAYGDNTGEPGFINLDKLATNRTGTEEYISGNFVDKEVSPETKKMYAEFAKEILKLEFPFIVNPCSEIVLLALGSYCVIGDVVPFFAKNVDDAEEAFRVATRALIRTNLLPAIYQKETKRTNRIGVSITGFHEWVWKEFGMGFKDILEIDPSGKQILDGNGNWIEKPSENAMKMWLTLSRFANAVYDESLKYSKELGVNIPHTMRTVKPAGTTSKLFGLTEGVHLPSMREYLRWVQFRNDDPLVKEYKNKNYPIRELKTYSGTTIVGFPTQPVICSLGMGDKLVTAAEATPEEQYRFLRLLELFWIRGTDENGNPIIRDSGNQISYTLKYNPEKVDLEHFKSMLLEYQSKVRCCSFMPQVNELAYEYTPEEAITKDQYEHILSSIKEEMQEDVGIEHVDCSTGACPINFNEEKAA